MELLLVRHGESTWNVAGRMQGQTASPVLTDRGRRQAGEVGARLLALGAARLLTSDLVRARQTAAIIGRTLRLEPETDPLLRERHYGTWQGRNSAEAIRATRSLPDHERVPGGESLVDVRQRWATLVTHGNVIVEAAGGPIPENGSVTRLLLDRWTHPLTPVDRSSDASPFPESQCTRGGVT